MMAEYVKVATENEIPAGSMKSFRVKNRRIVIYHAEDGYLALADECSHDYAPISSGHISNGEIVCPRHGARFDLRTGEAKAPPAVVGIDTFQVKVEDGNIMVRMD